MSPAGSNARVLEGRVAIVTGAGSGLGVGIADALADAGAEVVVSARSLESGERVAEAIRARGARAFALRSDVTVGADVVALVEATLARCGRLDIVVHNASSRASGKPARFEDIDAASWREQWEVSLGAAQRLARAAFPALRTAQGRGRFFVMSSTQALHGGSMNPAYAAIKNGLRGFVKSLAREWGAHGVLVAAIAPAALTGPAKEYLARNPGFAEQIRASTPLGRLGDPREDVGNALVAMCSDHWRYLTGGTFMVDGGSYLAQ